MLHRFEAQLNGASFSELDPMITLIDIDELRPEEDLIQAKRALRPGTMVSARVRRSLSVRLVFVISEYDVTKRTLLLNKVSNWVGDGGWLMINTRPGQRLYVTPDGLPHVSSSLKWTSDLELTLTAYEQPYWEQQNPKSVTISWLGQITPDGTYPQTYVECEVTNIGTSAMTTVTISCGDTRITLEDIDVPVNDTVSISYTDKGLLRIMAAGSSALANRTVDSSDDLIAISGISNAISVVADQSVFAQFKARGRYR